MDSRLVATSMMLPADLLERVREMARRKRQSASLTYRQLLELGLEVQEKRERLLEVVS